MTTISPLESFFNVSYIRLNGYSVCFFLKELGPRFLQTCKGSNGNVEPLSNYRISLGGIHPAIIRQGKTELRGKVRLDYA